MSIRPHLTLAAVVVAVIITASACSAIGLGSEAGESQFPDPRPYATVPAETSYPTTTTEETTVENTYPLEVQVYIETARDLLDSGAVPEEAVTTTAVQADLIDNYGITVDDATAAAICEEILR
ncbi:membrane protein [Gordonia phage Upyo]|nr:membrane protein [Gordonia phage Upyo]